MEIQDILTPNETEFKKIICGTYGLSQAAVSRWLSFTYRHTRAILDGSSRPSAETTRKLSELVKKLEAAEQEAANGNSPL